MPAIPLVTGPAAELARQANSKSWTAGKRPTDLLCRLEEKFRPYVRILLRLSLHFRFLWRAFLFRRRSGRGSLSGLCRGGFFAFLRRGLFRLRRCGGWFNRLRQRRAAFDADLQRRGHFGMQTQLDVVLAQRAQRMFETDLLLVDGDFELVPEFVRNRAG